MAFEAAKTAYAEIGVDVEGALRALGGVSLSLPAWQLDDVAGFEHSSGVAGSGLAVTGARPGAARTPAEMRADLAAALALIPGRHRVNLHALHADFSAAPKADRDAVGPQHFASWIAWAKDAGVRLDFNATMFAHPKAAAGLTLASKDPSVRAFWTQHALRAREIAAAIGAAQGSPCVHNLWIPDGFKDCPVDRVGHRRLLCDALDAVFANRASTEAHVVDAVEGKLFGIGLESCTVGSNDFYLAYAVSRGVCLCMDMGHYHVSESVADKISAVLPFVKQLLLHISRPVRWDSDHVCVANDDLNALAEELVRCGAIGSPKVHLALDFFDGSINRIGALVTGARAVQRSILAALLQPIDRLKQLEEQGKLFERLAMLEELKAMPFGAVFDEFCRRNNVPLGTAWIEQAGKYEQAVIAQRT